MTIRAKVAAIIDSHTAAINVGSKHGVNEGDFVTVLATRQIVDPDTGEELGEVETPRVRLRVGAVSPAFCVAHTFEPNNPDDLLAMFYQKGRDTTQAISEGVLTGYITVKVGMPVRIDRPQQARVPSRAPARKPAAPTHEDDFGPNEDEFGA